MEGISAWFSDFFSGWGDHFAMIWSEWLPMFGSGLVTTIELLVISSIVGIVLAVPLALMRLSPYRMLSWPANAYAIFMRGTPLLVQIFLIYYGIGQFDAVRQSVLWPLFREPYPCALIAFSLNMAAYVAEVVRGGILSVPRGEKEAALAVGMHTALMYRRVILPRAFRLTLPALSNEVVIQLKSTALAGTITLLDVTNVGRRLEAKTYTTEPLLIAGLIYICLTFVIARVFFYLERHFNAYQRSRTGR